MFLVEHPQPGKADAAQLSWACKASCPWPKRAKANLRKLRGRGCLRDTSRLANKDHSAERRIYHPGKKFLSSGFLADKKWGQPALAPVSPGGMGRPALAEEHQSGCAAVLHCLHPSKPCQEFPCSEPQARHHLCLTSSSSNYNRASQYFIYKAVLFYFTKGAAEGMFLVQLHWQQAIHIHRGCLGIYFIVEDIYFFVKLVLLVPYPNKTKTSSSYRVFGYLPYIPRCFGGPGRREAAGGGTSSGIFKNLIQRATASPGTVPCLLRSVVIKIIV